MFRYSSRHIWVTMVVVLGAVLLVAGCNQDEPSIQIPPPDPPVTEPRTPEELLERFRVAYENMDVEGYLALLEPDFLFLLQSETSREFPELGGALDLVEEERIHRRLFSGEAVVDPGGETRPALVTMAIQEFKALDTWNSTNDSVRFPDAAWAPFDIDLLFDCGVEFSTYKTTGAARIYIRNHIRMVNGKAVPYYLLAGMIDLTRSDKSVEHTPWGLIKGFYR